MKLDIVLTAEELPKMDISEKVVVVIDTLRATSSILTALESGCTAVIPVNSIEEAIFMKECLSINSEQILIAGERDGIKVTGFDFGNSPLEFKEANLKDICLILSTSNGTRAIKNARQAEKILIASLLNSNAAARYLLQLKADVVFACAGRLGEFSLEDFLTAGAITYYLKEMKQVQIQMDDMLFASASLFNYVQNNVFDFLINSKHGKYLQKLDFEEDVEFCSRLDVVDKVPEYTYGKIKYF